MTVSNPAYLKELYGKTQTLGEKKIASDAMMVIEGFDNIQWLIKQFPYPLLASGGEIEIPGPAGMASWQSQQIKVNQQGPIAMHETEQGIVESTLIDLIVNRRGKFNAKVYEGTVTHYSRVLLIKDAFIVVDQPERNWEDRSQVLNISGTMFYHFFGDDLPGNM